jgi:hypothetical protein
MALSAGVAALVSNKTIRKDCPHPFGAMARSLERFPESEAMFGFGDSSLFAIRPEALRWVGGFTGAQSLTPEGFAEAVRAG